MKKKNNMEKNKIIWPVLIVVAAIGAFLGGQYYGENSVGTFEFEDVTEESDNYALRLDIIGEGDVLRNNEGNNYGGEDQIYDNGDNVFLTPLSKEGYYFESWTGCKAVFAASNTCWVSMDSSKSVLAVFNQEQ
ncbi:MAG: hypothetical protein COV02_02175 [Candidatus Terrybacteria bacterium CG10_big_fil_rev_8_21_14_0_10_41_10]|uniref:Bacterial repeat domain-containing protein n=1 Tax=Candidatus Terrybacteria bacterium CG10_big_fil_rev_8_21_14_0_10_41_10 TaxID=1975026 RepID=A0A2M8LA59_9BACT|nr:MAG: hypothetical protein COV02_02175 [Candidatus Terrybacteria bacterium CG10_big_fil_rev_8_21_14_0_10_41_10]